MLLIRVNLIAARGESERWKEQEVSRERGGGGKREREREREAVGGNKVTPESE